MSDSNEIQIITNANDLNEYAEVMFKNINKAMQDKKTIDKSIIKPMIFKIPNDEEKPYINYSWMQVFIKLQENIYAMLESVLNRKLTTEEKQQVEIKIYIEKGSTIFEVLFDKMLDLFIIGAGAKIITGVTNMNTPTIIALTAAVSIAYVTQQLLNKKNENEKLSIEKQRNDIEKQKAENERLRIEKNAEISKITLELQEKNIENERLMNLEREKVQLEKEKNNLETYGKAINSMEHIFNFRENTEKSMARQMKKIDGLDSLKINDEEFSRKDIDELSKRKKSEKNEPVQERIKGLFKTKIISYQKDIPNITISGTDENGEKREFKNLPVVKEKITEEMHEAMDSNQLLYWDLIVTTNYNGVQSYMLNTVKVPEIQKL